MAELNVPFLDIKEQNRRIWPELQEALDGVIPQAQFILGPAVQRFEAAFAEYVRSEVLRGSQQRHVRVAHGLTSL